jgi:hypothetical protein
MNTNRWVLASIVAAAFLFIYGWVVYGLLLASYVTRIAPPGAMLPAGSENLGLIVVGCLIQGAALAWIFVMGRKRPGVMEGVRFGLAIGALIFGIYVLMAGVSPYTLRAALTFAIIDTVMYIGAGALIAALYKD